MTEVVFSKYADFKHAMDGEIKGAVQGFVAIGYLLKVARDTDILHESGYRSVAEFAKAEYGLTKDVVSRYIRINDRFSVNGYSMELRMEYGEYGIGKLQEMLALPDEINDVLMPQFSKEQIAETRREYQEEQNITDIEVMMEEQDRVQQSLDTLLARAVFQYLKENKEAFKKVNAAVWRAKSAEERFELVFKAFAPKGFDNLFARIPGEGKIMITIAGRDKDVTAVNMRSSDRENYTCTDMIETVRRILAKGIIPGMADEDTEGMYERIYGEKYRIAESVPEPEEKPEVAPVQPKEPVKAEPKFEAPKEKSEETKQKFEKSERKKEELNQKAGNAEQKAAVQQEEAKDDKKDNIKSEIVSVDVANENTEVSGLRETAVDIKPGEQHSTVPVQRQGRAEQLESSKQELTEEIHKTIDDLKAAVNNAMWNTAQMYLADIKMDIERIKKIEDEIADLNDISQMRIEDYEQKEE